MGKPKGSLGTSTNLEKKPNARTSDCTKCKYSVYIDKFVKCEVQCKKRNKFVDKNLGLRCKLFVRANKFFSHKRTEAEINELKEKQKIRKKPRYVDNVEMSKRLTTEEEAKGCKYYNSQNDKCVKYASKDVFCKQMRGRCGEMKKH